METATESEALAETEATTVLQVPQAAQMTQMTQMKTGMRIQTSRKVGKKTSGVKTGMKTGMKIEMKKVWMLKEKRLPVTSSN